MGMPTRTQQSASNNIKNMAKDKDISEAKAKFMDLIEVYKKQNPVKYEAKKDELKRKLDAIA